MVRLVVACALAACSLAACSLAACSSSEHRRAGPDAATSPPPPGTIWRLVAPGPARGAAAIGDTLYVAFDGTPPFALIAPASGDVRGVPIDGSGSPVLASNGRDVIAATGPDATGTLHVTVLTDGRTFAVSAPAGTALAVAASSTGWVACLTLALGGISCASLETGTPAWHAHPSLAPFRDPIVAAVGTQLYLLGRCETDVNGCTFNERGQIAWLDATGTVTMTLPMLDPPERVGRLSDRLLVATGGQTWGMAVEGDWYRSDAPAVPWTEAPPDGMWLVRGRALSHWTRATGIAVPVADDLAPSLLGRPGTLTPFPGGLIEASDGADHVFLRPVGP